MWEYYRKTFLMTQTLVVLVSLALLLYWKVPFVGVLVFVAVMELFAVFGAAWADRLRRKVLAAPPRQLPANRR
jgi:hypothetical protein